MMTDAIVGVKTWLGRVGENETQVVRFNVGTILAEYPDAQFTVLNRRPCDAAAYPVNAQYVTREGENVLWTVQSGDLTAQGTGECAIRAEQDGKIKKTVVFMTQVGKALDETANPPQPWQSWVEQVKDDADRAEEAASKIIPIKDTVTDKSIANVPDACEGAVDALVLKINPIQSGFGDPSPDNVRAISGRSSVVLKQIGVNLLTNKFTTGTSGTVTFTAESGSVKTNGTASSTTTWRSDAINVTAGTEYKLTGCPSGGGNSTYRLDVRDTSGNIIEGLNYDAGSGATFTIPTGTTQIKIGIRIANGVDTNGLVFIPILVKSTDVPTEYTATIPTPPGTVYGGELDWKQGKLKVTHGIVNLGDLDWTYNAQNFNFRSETALENAKLPSGATKMPSAICSCYPIVTYDYLSTHTDCATIIFSSSGYAGRVWLNDSTFTDPDAFKTAMSGMTICYELETPVEYDLASIPDDIMLSFGENNLWISSGTVKSMTYTCDTKLYIDKKVSELQALILEN